MSEQFSELLARKVLGPFEVLDMTGPDTIQLCTIPFQAIEGGAVTVGLAENVSIGGAGGTFSMACVEIEFVGLIQGVVDVLKRVWITGLSGPARKSFEAWEVYDTLEIRARNMMGGRSGGNNDPSNPGGPVLLDTAHGFFAKVTVAIQPKTNVVKIQEKKRLAHE